MAPSSLYSAQWKNLNPQHIIDYSFTKIFQPIVRTGNNDSIAFIGTNNPNHNINLKKFHSCLDKIKNKELKICFQSKKKYYYPLDYGAHFRKKIITFFFCTKYFFDATSSCFCPHEILFCATSTFFSLHETLFRATSTHVFVNTKILFVQRQTFCFNTKLFFTKFLFWTSFRMLCYGDIFLLSQQKYITCQKISYLCDTKKLISFFFFFCITIFLYSSFTLHIVSMLIFAVVILKTKKLLIHLLLTCLIYRSSY